MESSARAPLVFLHGGGIGPWMWEAQRAHFGSRYGILTPTLPGHGRDGTVYPGHERAADEIAAEISAAFPGRAVSLLGFSLGGQTALTLAARHPSLVGGLVVNSSLLSPWGSPGLLGALMAMSAPLARRERFARAQARASFIPDALLPEYLADSAAATPEGMRAIALANFGFRLPRALLGHPRPVLLLAGSTEPRALRRDFTRTADGWPTAELEIVRGIGHGYALQDPVGFTERIQSWLDRPGPSAEGAA